MKILLALVGISLAFGCPQAWTSESTSQAPKEQEKKAEKRTVIVYENSTITIAAGVKFTILPARTAKGVMLRLTTLAIVIDAPQFRIIEKDRTSEIQADANGEMHVRVILKSK